MPQQDRTGPLGQGPMTGRGFGICGKGFGFRQGFGRGFGRRCFQPVQFNESDEKKILQEELKEIEVEKQEIQNRLKELK
jgi:hypothetical protein